MPIDDGDETYPPEQARLLVERMLARITSLPHFRERYDKDIEVRIAVGRAQRYLAASAEPEADDPVGVVDNLAQAIAHVLRSDDWR